MNLSKASEVSPLKVIPSDIMAPGTMAVILKVGNEQQAVAARQFLPSLYGIAAKHGLKYVYGVIAKIIAANNKRLSEKNRLSAEAARILIEDIFVEFPHYRPSDVSLALRNGTTALYGEVYGELSVMQVMSWLRRYRDELPRYPPHNLDVQRGIRQLEYMTNSTLMLGDGETKGASLSNPEI